MPERVEHYVTLFDSNFLPAGLALVESLDALHVPYHLWIIGTDELVIEQLAQLRLPAVTVVPVGELETDALRAVRGGRTRGEYCWTLTPFCADAVFERAPAAERVTYLDADLFFFDTPAPFFAEFEASGKDVLITEHAYAPLYDRARRSGRFCVQFLTFRRSPGSAKVLRWWQERCLEWCYARYEDGKFGDQKYLDVWPQLFAAEAHILSQTSRTLAPWNVDHFSRRSAARPVFYHFQGFRILSSSRIKLHHAFRVAARNMWIYERYLAAIGRALARIVALGYPVPAAPEHRQRFKWLKYLAMRLTGMVRFIDLRQLLADAGVEPAQEVRR